MVARRSLAVDVSSVRAGRWFYDLGLVD